MGFIAKLLVLALLCHKFSTPCQLKARHTIWIYAGALADKPRLRNPLTDAGEVQLHLTGIVEPSLTRMPYPSLLAEHAWPSYRTPHLLHTTSIKRSQLHLADKISQLIMASFNDIREAIQLASQPQMSPKL